jgi:hypothetical protein
LQRYVQRGIKANKTCKLKKNAIFAAKSQKSMIRKEYYQEYEKKVERLLLEYCVSRQWTGKQLLEVVEIDEKWNEIAPEYMVNAVPEIAQYPQVALAWAGYIGMALATFWDTRWVDYANDKTIYQQLLQARGFDEMDEYITEDVLKIKLESFEGKQLVSKMQSLAQFVLDLIRKEQIAPQTKDAFHVFARSVKLLFKFGVAIELYRRGYKYEKAIVSE